MGMIEGSFCAQQTAGSITSKREGSEGVMS
jgi:hypothetical protein